MATTISGTSITFNDGSVQSANAIISTASALQGQLGSYAFLRYPGNATARAAGFTIAGSSLVFTADGGNIADPAGSGAPAGSWRLMGNLHTVTFSKTAVWQNSSVWLRYA